MCDIHRAFVGRREPTSAKLDGSIAMIYFLASLVPPIGLLLNATVRAC